MEGLRILYIARHSLINIISHLISSYVIFPYAELFLI